MSSKRYWRILALTLSVMFLFVAAQACGPATEPEPEDEPTESEPATPETPSDEKKVLTSRLGQDPGFLDPAHLGQVDGFAVASNIFSGLVRYDWNDWTIHPDLASDWDISEDGLEWTFYLREGVQWHKGFGEFTAADVKYTFDRIRDDATGSRWQREWDNVRELEVVDDYTVRYHLHDASPVFIHSLTKYRQGMLVNQAAVEEFGEDFNTNVIGTGPFMLESWAADSEVVLVANPDYWEGAPNLDEVRYVIIVDETVAHMAFDACEIDVMAFTQPEKVEEYRNRDDVKLQYMPTTAIYTWHLKIDEAPYDDLRVRQAIAHAIDKQLFIDEIRGGTATIANSILAPDLMGHNPDVPKYEYDPDRSRELLADAGYPDGFTTTALVPETELDREVASVVQAMLAEVGIDMQIEIMDMATWTAATTAGETPMGRTSIGGRPDPHIVLHTFFHGARTPPDGRFFAMYYDGDDLLDAAAIEMDPERRRELYEEWEMRFMTDLPSIPIFHSDTMAVTKPHVENWEHDQYRHHWLLETDLVQ